MEKHKVLMENGRKEDLESIPGKEKKTVNERSGQSSRKWKDFSMHHAVK